MIEEIQKYFESNDSIFDFQYFKKIKGEVYKKGRLSIKIPNGSEIYIVNSLQSGHSRFDFVPSIIEAVKKEIQRTILNGIYSNENSFFNDFIDLIEVSYDLRDINLAHRLLISDVKNIVSSNKVVSEYFLELPMFSYFNQDKITNTGFSKNGDIFNKISVFSDIYIDKDDFILSFDDIFFDIKYITPYISRESFNSKLIVDFEYYTKIVNPIIFYIIDSYTSKNYSLYKSEQRDKKLIDILDYGKGIKSSI
jgi:hypothetical protein